MASAFQLHHVYYFGLFWCFRLSTFHRLVWWFSLWYRGYRRYSFSIQNNNSAHAIRCTPSAFSVMLLISLLISSLLRAFIMAATFLSPLPFFCFLIFWLYFIFDTWSCTMMSFSFSDILVVGTLLYRAAFVATSFPRYDGFREPHTGLPRCNFCHRSITHLCLISRFISSISPHLRHTYLSSLCRGDIYFAIDGFTGKEEILWYFLKIPGASLSRSAPTSAMACAPKCLLLPHARRCRFGRRALASHELSLAVLFYATLLEYITRFSAAVYQGVNYWIYYDESHAIHLSFADDISFTS